MEWEGKGALHANIDAKFRSCVKFEGNETNIKGAVLVQLGAENARIFTENAKSKHSFWG